MDTVAIKINNAKINQEKCLEKWNYRLIGNSKYNYFRNSEDKHPFAQVEARITPNKFASREQYYPVISQKIDKYRNYFVEIQVSIPKLILGSSLFDLDLSSQIVKEEIYRAIFAIVKPILLPEPTIETIKNAEIVRIDLAKNIILEGIDSTNAFIDKARTFSLGKSLYATRTIYTENQKEGYGLSFWNQGQSYCLYNKVAEVLDIKERNITPFIYQIQKLISKMPIQVLRLERRLQTPDVTKIILSHIIGEKDIITLADFLNCKYDLSNILIKEMMSNFRKNNLGLFTSVPIKEDEITHIKQSIQKFGYGETSRSFLNRAILEAEGIASGFVYIQSVTSERSLRNYKQELKRSEFKVYSPSVNDVFQQIDEQLELNKPFTFQALEEMYARR